MARYFKSDNTAPVAPQILDALREANTGFARGYGDDPLSGQLDARFSALFERPVRVFPVTTGTAANALALATLVPPYGAVLTHSEGHIVRDECGAPEFMSGGARLMLIEGIGAKVTAAALEGVLDANPTSVHTVQPRALSITQATELGTVYRPDELAALCSLAHARGLAVHMDGARFANAVASLGCSPAEATWRAGVDVLSFGATKNGAMAAEAVVFFKPELIADFEFRRKRAAHLISKMRYISAQLLAYIEDGLWLTLAARANHLAARIGAAAGSALLHPVEANEIFVRIGEAAAARLREAGFEFYDWGAARSGEARFVVSWNQAEEDVEALCTALRARGAWPMTEASTAEYIDIGINLTHDSYDADREAVLRRAIDRGVRQFIVTGASVQGSRDALSLAKAAPRILRATAGCHPHHAIDLDAAALSSLDDIAADPLVAAIGECGLDYHRSFSAPREQRAAFAAQLELAIRHGKPLFLHCRDAHADFMAMLRERAAVLPRAVLHCFTGVSTELDECLEFGLYIGITGWICDERRGTHLKPLVGRIPRGRLMIETDGPYLLPRDLQPKPDSRRNEPMYLPHIAAVIAAARGERVEDLAAHTTATAREFFSFAWETSSAADST